MPAGGVEQICLATKPEDSRGRWIDALGTGRPKRASFQAAVANPTSPQGGIPNSLTPVYPHRQQFGGKNDFFSRAVAAGGLYVRVVPSAPQIVPVIQPPPRVLTMISRQLTAVGLLLLLVPHLVARDDASSPDQKLVDRTAAIRAAIDSQLANLETLYKDLHTHPELSLMEVRTS